MSGLKVVYMYIVFVNKKGSEKLAIRSCLTSYYEIDDIILNIINNICDINNYRFMFKEIVSRKTPLIDPLLFYKKQH